MDSRTLVKLSKFLSLVLRHKPDEIGITLDSQGWVEVEELLTKIKESGNNISFEELKYIVDTSDKKRFAFNEDFSKIRANQGHSIDIKLDFKEVIPPDFLYHGTAEKNIESILKTGINKGNRHHVHLSINKETAFKVGIRHGKAVILKIKSKEMYESGIKFYISENNVWLTDFVSKEYIDLM